MNDLNDLSECMIFNSLFTVTVMYSVNLQNLGLFSLIKSVKQIIKREKILVLISKPYFRNFCNIGTM